MEVPPARIRLPEAVQMNSRPTEPRHDERDTKLTHIPIPFALRFSMIAPGVIRCEESNAAQLRALWAYILLYGAVVVSVLGVSLIRYPSRPLDPPVILVLALAPFVLGALSFALFRRYRVPLRQLEYHAGSGVFHTRIYRGKGMHMDWRAFRPGEWTVRVQQAEIGQWGWKGRVDWKGHVARLDLGPDRLVLICSKRREKVLAYIRSLPIDHRSVIDDATVLRGQAWLGGDLID